MSQILLAALIFVPVLLGLYVVTIGSAAQSGALSRFATQVRHPEFLILILSLATTGWWIAYDCGWCSDLMSRLDWQAGDALLFWIAPVITNGIFVFSLCIAEKHRFRLKWSYSSLLWRTWWRLASFVIPLQLLAVGFSAIFDGRVVGFAWLVGAGLLAKIATGLLRHAQGMRFNRLKSGENRNRALRLAQRMGVSLRHVFLVPAGKGHLTNAYGMSDAIALTDNLGVFLNDSQINAVVAHELAHVKLKHARKYFWLEIAVYGCLAAVCFRLSFYAPFLRPLAQLTAVFGPLLFLRYFSRSVELDADRTAVQFTDDPESAVQALVKLHNSRDVGPSIERNKLATAFATHPPLSQRAAAIASLYREDSSLVNRILTAAGRQSPG